MSAGGSYYASVEHQVGITQEPLSKGVQLLLIHRNCFIATVVLKNPLDEPNFKELVLRQKDMKRMGKWIRQRFFLIAGKPVS